MKRELGRFLLGHADTLTWVALLSGIVLSLALIALLLWLVWKSVPRTFDDWIASSLIALVRAPATGAVGALACHSFLWVQNASSRRRA